MLLLINAQIHKRINQTIIANKADNSNISWGRITQNQEATKRRFHIIIQYISVLLVQNKSPIEFFDTGEVVSLDNWAQVI